MKDYKLAPEINLTDGVHSGVGDTPSAHSLPYIEQVVEEWRCTHKDCSLIGDMHNEKDLNDFRSALLSAMQERDRQVIEMLEAEQRKYANGEDDYCQGAWETLEKMITRIRAEV
jgi:uncharacterized iron-regulated protein